MAPLNEIAMKKLLIFMWCLALLGCAAASNTYPPGKTDADWEKDEAYCLQKSGKVTGFLGSNPLGLAINASANQKYNECLRELGWLK